MIYYYLTISFNSKNDETIKYGESISNKSYFLKIFCLKISLSFKLPIDSISLFIYSKIWGIRNNFWIIFKKYIPLPYNLYSLLNMYIYIQKFNSIYQFIQKSFHNIVTSKRNKIVENRTRKDNQSSGSGRGKSSKHGSFAWNRIRVDRSVGGKLKQKRRDKEWKRAGNIGREEHRRIIKDGEITARSSRDDSKLSSWFRWYDPLEEAVSSE